MFTSPFDKTVVVCQSDLKQEKQLTHTYPNPSECSKQLFNNTSTKKQYLSYTSTFTVTCKQTGNARVVCRGEVERAIWSLYKKLKLEDW